MLFNSFAYLVFLPVVLALYWALPFKYRVPLLLVASYFFYMFWKPTYGLLMIALTAINYGFGFLLERKTKAKRIYLVAAIVINLAALGFFKYAYFLHDSLSSALGFFSLPALPPIAIDIILPLGISFFVFEFIHYVVDVYKGEKAIRSFVEFALFPSFFPTQIAGPIKRFQDFIPQLKSPRTMSLVDFNEGVELVLFGLFKKVALADNLSFVVNRCYAHIDLVNGTDLWLATYAFVFQIYFDFSGYTDIARGSARLLGFKVPLNFKLPYLSSSMTMVWRRWHISLSSWLRDYVFIPLGGSKKGALRTYFNVFFTMAICGLWHGASMHYVAFGVLMGVFMIVHRIWRRLCERSSVLATFVANRAFHYCAIMLTFNCWAIGMVFFRATDMNAAWAILQKMFSPSITNFSALAPTILSSAGSVLFPYLPLALFVFVLAQILVSRFQNTPGVMPLHGNVMRSVYLAALILILLIASPDSTPQFIYFQF